MSALERAGYFPHFFNIWSRPSLYGYPVLFLPEYLGTPHRPFVEPSQHSLRWFCQQLTGSYGSIDAMYVVGYDDHNGRCNGASSPPVSFQEPTITSCLTWKLCISFSIIHHCLARWRQTASEKLTRYCCFPIKHGHIRGWWLFDGYLATTPVYGTCPYHHMVPDKIIIFVWITPTSFICLLDYYKHLALVGAIIALIHAMNYSQLLHFYG